MGIANLLSVLFFVYCLTSAVPSIKRGSNDGSGCGDGPVALLDGTAIGDSSQSYTYNFTSTFAYPDDANTNKYSVLDSYTANDECGRAGGFVNKGAQTVVFGQISPASSDVTVTFELTNDALGQTMDWDASMEVFSSYGDNICNPYPNNPGPWSCEASIDMCQNYPVQPSTYQLRYGLTYTFVLYSSQPPSIAKFFSLTINSLDPQLEENFESGINPDWNVNNYWQVVPSNDQYVNQNTQAIGASNEVGSYVYNLDPYDHNTSPPTLRTFGDAFFILPSVDLSNAGSAQLTFDSAVGGSDFTASISVARDATSSFTQLATLDSSDTDWRSLQFDLSDYLGLGGVRIKFTYSSTGSSQSTWAVDQIKVSVVSNTFDMCTEGHACLEHYCTSTGSGLKGCQRATNNDDNCKSQAREVGCSSNVCDPSNPNADTEGCVYIERCDDSIDCTVDECVNTTAGTMKCLHTVDMNLCDDNIDCTYELVCDVYAKGFDSVSGCIRIPMNEWCADSDPCTTDVCDATNFTQPCQHIQMDCDDGLACTQDYCVDGVCHNDAIDSQCDDHFDCTKDTCSKELGKCVNQPMDNWCSNAGNLCMDAYCRPSLSSNVSGCAFFPHDCHDGIACTVDSCDPTNGKCFSTADNSLCNDHHDCTDDTCDLELGKCTNIPNSENCADGLRCTVDFCDCESGNCALLPVDCSDEIHCTIDACTEEEGCVNTPDDSLCDDHVDCTIDRCDISIGRCTNYPSDDYCQNTETNQSNLYTCDPAKANQKGPYPSNGCVGTPNPCDDGILCTLDYADEVTGKCHHDAVNASCYDGMDCTLDICNGAVGCINIPQNSECEDGNPCTINTCGTDGSCHQEDVYCNDEIACTTDLCDVLTGNCTFVANNNLCDDGIDCTTDVCDVNLGKCTNLPTDSLCTAHESECSYGVCSIEYMDCLYVEDKSQCDDRVQCTLDYCNGDAGCSHELQHGLCDDGIPCTMDLCTKDGCVFMPMDNWCDDNNTCTEHTCSPIWNCIISPLDSLCDDGHNCTLDYCDVDLGCQHKPENSFCSDGIACTEDICSTDKDTYGECVYVSHDSWCQDDFNCTINTCDSVNPPSPSGCRNDQSACNWADQHELCISCTSAYVNLVEKRAKDGSGASLDIRTSNGDGSMDTKISFLSTNQVIIGGSLEDTPISADDGLVVVDPVRLVPVASLGECNEIRRGTIAVLEVPKPCGQHTCYQDTLVVCALGDNYEWKKL